MERKLIKEDVWGKFADDHTTLLNRGMIVAQGFGKLSEEKLEEYKQLAQVSDTCPVWKDKLSYKSVTVICKPEEENEVCYWLAYVHGGDYEKRKVLEDGRIALRSNYQCW